jgi:hypothetical protein
LSDFGGYEETWCDQSVEGRREKLGISGVQMWGKLAGTLAGHHREGMAMSTCRKNWRVPALQADTQAEAFVLQVNLINKPVCKAMHDT